MNDYRKVSDALRAGADPAMMCATCPWDRTCISPPSMTAEDIAREKAKAVAADAEQAENARRQGKPDSMPMGALMTMVMLGGKDIAADVCPVFSARLRSSKGRDIADGMKATMTGWDDNA